MSYHPAIYTLIATLTLLVFINTNKVFKAISIISPICTLLALHFSKGAHIVNFLGSSFIISFSLENKIIAFAFIIVTLAANLYVTSLNKKIEIIVGGFYLSISLICLFAGDFISMFIALELMIIAATILIFVGSTSNSEILSKQYFLTHLFSGSLILICISYITVKYNIREIIQLKDLINNTQENAFIYYILLFGCLINIAAFPFSNWLINCYAAASNSGFIYLISFTTKVSVVILMKLFSGLELLKFFGIAMILYGGIYACFENNIRMLLCYLAIYQLGFILIAIGVGTSLALYGAILYLAIHIIYKALLVLSFATLQDNANIENCSELKAIKNWLLNFSFSLCFLMIINFPLSATFICKLLISPDIQGSFSYYFIQASMVLMFLILPFKQLLNRGKSINIKIKKYQAWSLLILIITLLGLHLTVIEKYLMLSSYYPITGLRNSLIKQVIIIILGMSFLLMPFVPLTKISLKKLDFDVLVLVSKAFIYFYNIYLKAKTNASNNDEAEILPLENKILRKLSAFHDQSVAISLVFTLLIILLLTLIKN